MLAWKNGTHVAMSVVVNGQGSRGENLPRPKYLETIILSSHGLLFLRLLG